MYTHAPETERNRLHTLSLLCSGACRQKAVGNLQEYTRKLRCAAYVLDELRMSGSADALAEARALLARVDQTEVKQGVR